MVVNKKRLALGTYLFIALVFVPLLTPLRQLQLFSPVLVLIISIPLIVLLSMVILGGRVLSIRNYMSLALIVTFVQAALVGLDNAVAGDIRSYLSHLFQLFSAIVMLAAGAHWSDDLGENFWRRFAMMALFAASASTLMSLRVWDAGDIGRYYTPAYILIFVVAFGLAVRPEGQALTIGSVLVLIISNKRGPLLSVVLMILTYYGSRLIFFKRSRFRPKKWTGIALISIAIALPIVVIVAPIQNLSEDIILVRAFDQTTTRLLRIVTDDPEEFDLDAFSAGRIREIVIGFKHLQGIASLIGNGAGWTAELYTDRNVQNLHFTPLSLAVVFGVPFAAFFYLYSVFLIMRSMRRCFADGTVTEKIAVIYLIGSLLHTMVAYSIFIDLLNFFFIGVLVNAKSRLRRNNYCKSKSIESVQCQTPH